MVTIPKPVHQPKARRPIQRGKRPRQNSRVLRRRAAKLALEVWGRLIRERDGGCSVQRHGVLVTEFMSEEKTPFCGGPLHAHHLFEKGPYPSTRLDFTNGITLCRNHHMWAHYRPAEFSLWLDACMSRENQCSLRERAVSRDKTDPMGFLAALSEAHALNEREGKAWDKLSAHAKGGPVA